MAKEKYTDGSIYQITDGCTLCDACHNECSTGAIIRGKSKYHIDENKCDFCGVCEDVCPARAIVNVRPLEETEARVKHHMY